MGGPVRSAAVRSRLRLLVVGVGVVLAPLATAVAGAARAEVEVPLAASPGIIAAGTRIGRLPGGVEAKTDAIVHLIFDDVDGLGFTYRSAPTLTAAEAFELRAGNCLSLVNLFVALARTAGLKAFPVEVEDFVSFSRERSTMVRRTHVVGGVAVVGRLLTFDFLPGREKSYRRVRAISDPRHAALYFNAVAVEAMLGGDSGRAGDLFRRALSCEDDTPEVWSNYAVLARRQGDVAAAEARYLRALRSEPGFLPALTNLARLVRARGETDRAGELEARALKEQWQNPYFLLEEAVRRIAAGDLGEASRLAVRARRIDNSIPEVYVVLGRIDLLRGRPDRAARDFTTARRRSLALSAAFRDGLSRKIDKLERLANEP